MILQILMGTRKNQIKITCRNDILGLSYNSEMILWSDHIKWKGPTRRKIYMIKETDLVK